MIEVILIDLYKILIFLNISFYLEDEMLIDTTMEIINIDKQINKMTSLRNEFSNELARLLKSQKKREFENTNEQKLKRIKSSESLSNFIRFG